MKVTNEIRQAFLFAGMGLDNERTEINKLTVRTYITVAFEAVETEELMKWLTLQEKVLFGRKLLELSGGRDLSSDLTEDR